jgi:hypothetical protein
MQEPLFEEGTMDDNDGIGHEAADVQVIFI